MHVFITDNWKDTDQDVKQIPAAIVKYVSKTFTKRH